MNTVLVLGECDASGALQNATLQLLALARARQVPADVVVDDGDRPRLVQELSAHGVSKVWFLTGDVARYSARKLASAIRPSGSPVAGIVVSPSREASTGGQWPALHSSIAPPGPRRPTASVAYERAAVP